VRVGNQIDDKRELQTALGIIGLVEQEEPDNKKSQPAIREILQGSDQEKKKTPVNVQAKDVKDVLAEFIESHKDQI
jgi:hypothetical protein